LCDSLPEKRAPRPMLGTRLLWAEAVAQTNRGVRRSQSRHEPILTDVLYGSLGAFDGLAGGHVP
jgi:hypothetical protein